jgi:hypothetical protein
MRSKIFYLALLLCLFLAGIAVAATSWTYLTEVASVKITVLKPVLFDVIEMKNFVSISNGSFSMYGHTSFYPSDTSNLISILIVGLSKEEKNQFTALRLHSEIGGYESTEDLLGDKDVFEIYKYFEEAGDSVSGNFTLSGTLASDITRDEIKFKILGCWGNV